MIRTCDPLVPSEVRYQAAPHPVEALGYTEILYLFVNCTVRLGVSSPRKILNLPRRQSQAAPHPVEKIFQHRVLKNSILKINQSQVFILYGFLKTVSFTKIYYFLTALCFYNTVYIIRVIN